LVSYVSQLFRDRQVLNYLTPERVNPATLPAAILFLLYALRQSDAVSPQDLDILYTRFIYDCPQEDYWRAYWDGIRQLPGVLPPLRLTILSQIHRTEWHKLYSETTEGHQSNQLVIHVLSTILDGVRKPLVFPTISATTAAGGEVEEGLVECFQHILRKFFERDLEDAVFRGAMYDLMVRLFHIYPYTGEERNRLAETIFIQASTEPEFSSGGDLFVLKALLSTDTSDAITGWNREDTISRLCRASPALPELLLADLAGWKCRQRGGMEVMQRVTQVDFRMQFLTYALAADRNAGGTFVFSRQTLEEFWTRGLVREMGEPREDEVELCAPSVGLESWWGGDGATDTVRSMFFHFFSLREFRWLSGVVIFPTPFALPRPVNRSFCEHLFVLLDFVL
jgi:hypothetical protein